MDLTDFQKASVLITEKQTIQMALDRLASGGRITGMIIGTANDRTLFAHRQIVPTGFIDYPPQMVDAIKAAFEGRLHAIEDELGNLGVTGLPNR